ncbi:hypothetical protein QF024_003020 [Chryseobacterium nepalense]|nr:hypothetical protein [Chryseobacterium nepalense]
MTEKIKFCYILCKCHFVINCLRSEILFLCQGGKILKNFDGVAKTIQSKNTFHKDTSERLQT